MIQSGSSSWRQVFSTLRNPRLLMIFALGFVQGFPWVLAGSVMTLWLQSEGLSRTGVGYFGLVFSVYAINWTWAPFLDRVRLPILYRLFGQRRSWIVLCLAMITVLVWLISQQNPSDNLVLISVLTLGVTIISATQDIAIDAYRIESFAPDDEQMYGHAAAAATSGWWAGYAFIGGAVALYLGGETIGLSWPQVYQCLCLMLLAQIIMVIFIPSPEYGRSEAQEIRRQAYEQQLNLGRFSAWWVVTVVDPFVDFFRRCGWQLAIGILLFVFTFKLGEAFLGRMSLLFYKEVGFSTEQIGTYSKLIGGMTTVVFSFMGAAISARYGVIRGLFIGGISMAGSNLMFSVIALAGPSESLLLATILVDGFTAAFATVAFVSFISYFTSRTYTATQYALLASLGNFGRTTLSASSGQLVDGLHGSWALFFVITALMVIPGLCLLWWISRRMKSRSVTDSIESSNQAE